MERGLKVYLFRHGQTTYNRDGRFTGWQDPRLTEKGFRNARKVALELKNKKFEVAFYTRLRRSQQTLKEVLKYHPECKKLIKDDRMIERNYGDLNGTSHEDFINRVGKKLVKLEVEGDAYENMSLTDRRRVEKFLGVEEFDLIHRGWNVPPPGPDGESFEMVEKRVGSFIKDLIKMMKKKKVNVAISAHGNSIRLFRKIMEKTSVAETTRWFIPYDRVFEYNVGSGF
ncbi:MAG: histidine phosphatase family protein [Nanoarchaeota archaeon]|nr:histidine phosphatase family protein [Nanoarchaeota archaeon]MBU0977866.1 histidine phosphatase family protein [Nanoarchaeota archaeon]